jgi:eukaryotic-like serine/threonine-protein kinase
MYCPYCGTKNEENYNFCKKCGKRLPGASDQEHSRESLEAQSETKEAVYTPSFPRSSKPSWQVWAFGVGAVGLLIVMGWFVIRSLGGSSRSSNKPDYAATSTPEETFKIGSTWKRPADGMTMMYVPEGNFLMGMDVDKALQICQQFYNGCRREWYVNNAPMHTVYLDSYWIDKTEVTNTMYALCVQAGACQPPTKDSSFTRSSYYGNSQYANYPVVYVDWHRANSYCKWAGAHLPTEAEWEKAARGTDGRTYPWGDSTLTCLFLNYGYAARNGCVGDSAKVGSFPAGASLYGALDMLGNVWEWVADWESNTDYSNSPSINPTGPSYGTKRILRGGSWYDSGTSILSTNRWWAAPLPDYAENIVGFRCSRSP